MEEKIVEIIGKYLQQYLENCTKQKCLDPKTVKAYGIDLKQFQNLTKDVDELSKKALTDYIAFLHQTYKPKTAKRKIASVKAFFNYLVYEEIIEQNPFLKIQIKFQEPKLLPRTIPQTLIQKLFSGLYSDLYRSKKDTYTEKTVLRDICILELLFATGMRISELCHLHPNDFDWELKRIRVYGKGNKERVIQICNDEIVKLLQRYRYNQRTLINETDYFFVNRMNRRLSEQSVRLMICKYAQKINSPLHITPHMFRHTFATALLEENVDIRYIQKMMGHSSITTTEIYTYVTSSKQNEILKTQHPRNKMSF